MISILILFLLSNSVQAKYNRKLKELDDVAAKLLAFGDSDNTFPADRLEASRLCFRFNRLSPLGKNLVHRVFHRYGVDEINQFMSANAVCQLFSEIPYEMSLFAAEVNSKSKSLSNSYQEVSNFMGQASDENAKNYCHNYPLMACYVQKWFKEVKSQLTATSQIIFQKIFQFYFDFSNDFKPLSNCEWSDMPRAKSIPFKAYNLNFAAGVSNCFDDYKE